MSQSNTVSDGEFALRLTQSAELADAILVRTLDERADIQPRLHDAMRYTLSAPGKRVRAAMVFWCCEAVCGQVRESAHVAAAAIEMVHCYSLVHDDLPAMDDDDLRRGRPTCHVAYDEATAILTGDALLTMAFELLAGVDAASVAVRLIGELARAAGPAGMIAGQMADLEGEKMAGTETILEYIHINKTAKMFSAACRMGAICGAGSEEQVEALGKFGLKTGLGFQIRDDILDVEADSGALGKTAGKDAAQGKMTYPAVVGMEKAKLIQRQLAEEAVSALGGFGGETDLLRALAIALISRSK